jgi:hypothetical protein
MNARVLKLIVVFSLVASGLISLPAMAQQITYYDFDNLNFSPTCTATDPGAALFCFNKTTTQTVNATYPALETDAPYPAIVDPNPTDNSPVDSTHSSLQISDGAFEYSSAWFGVPQKVLNGFTAYVAFRLNSDHVASPGNGDGIAFVLQNAAGGGDDNEGSGDGDCKPVGAGLNIVSPYGACLGYGGIDNSLAIEFDTYQNDFDPDANHIAMQSCGLGESNVGLANSSDHARCNLAMASQTATPTLILPNMSDGNVHQVVIEYSGATGTPANQWQVFIDPVFIAGTHTPDPTQSTAVITTTVDLTHYMTLQNSGSANDSAYVGFTGASGGSYENQEILAWTFTPHSPAIQQQPLQSAGTQTTFPFGNHTYGVTYESGDTSNVDMVVTAITVSPTLFQSLIAGSSFTGSTCQIYDGTGGNCIVYSVSCVKHGSNPPEVVDCPASADPSQALIDVKSAYDNTIQPTSPGMLQGDPLLAPIASISGNGTTATVTCAGECAATAGQTVTILGNSDTNYDITTTVITTTINTFTFASPDSTGGTGGYVNSSNLQNIFVSYVPQRIDGTTSGKTKNFSEIVSLAQTLINTSTTITPPAPPITYGSTPSVTVSVAPAVTGSGIVTGNVSLTIDSGTSITEPLGPAGSASFTLPVLIGGRHSLSASYQGVAGSLTTPGFNPSSTTAPTILNVGLASPSVTFTGAPMTAAYQSSFLVYATTNATVLPTIMGTAGVCSVGTVGGSASSASATVTMSSGTGTCSLTATWGPDTDYSGTSMGQTTTASKLTPTITWMPAPIQLGYPLTAAQLDATSNVLGAFTYAPPLGTVVNTTSQTVMAQFTPSAPLNYNPANTSVNLTVTAGPLAMISPPSINFGTVYYGSVNSRNVTVTNIGDAPMTITGPFISLLKGGTSNEYGEVNQCPKSLAAGKSCTLTVVFVAGPFYTPQTAVLNVMDNAPGNPPGNPQTVMLTATVINPQATLSANSENFGTQKLGTTSGTRTITLKNTGATALTNSVSVTGANPGDFIVSAAACPSSLGAGSSCSITVAFKPVSKTPRSATISISDNAPNSPQTVALSGKGD